MMSDVPVDGWVLSQTEYETLMASVAELDTLAARAERLRVVAESVERLYTEIVEQEWMWELRTDFERLESGDLADDIVPPSDER